MERRNLKRRLVSQTFFWFGLALFSVALQPGLRAEPYTFIEGYTVLDEANLPGIGTNLAVTAGIERGFGVDPENGIIYLSRGSVTTQDGRTNTSIGAFAAITTNEFGGSNFTDTGLVAENTSSPAVNFSNGEIVPDFDNDRFFFQGQGTNDVDFLSVVYEAPRGILGGAPAGGNPSALNPELASAIYIVNDLTNLNGTVRGGAPRGIAARTINGVTTVYVALGNHAEAWSNDATNGSPQYPWRRLWAALRPPIQDTVVSRLTLGDTRLNGIDVDDEGNCYFTVEFTSPPRIWRVPANAALIAPEPMNLDFDDRAVGGSNSGDNAVITPVITRLPSPAMTIDGTNTFYSPQDVTFFRTDGRKGLFVSSIAVLPTSGRTRFRSIARLVLDEPGVDENGYPFSGAALVDAFGSSAAPEYQDLILQTMRLKSALAADGVTQPLGGATTDMLYTQVNSVTNPTEIYFQAFLTDTNKGQTVPTAAIARAAIPPLPAAPALVSVSPTNGATTGGDLITLNGSNFVSGATVIFGSTPASSVNFSNATLLTATTPAHLSGVVTVTVQNPDGQIGVLPDSFAFTGPPATFQIISISLLDPDSVEITWEANTDAVYEVQAEEDLLASNWTALGMVTAATTTASFTNTGVSTNPARYYRVGRLP